MNLVPISLLDVSDPCFQAKFWKQVVSNGLCWEWKGAKAPRGYGVVVINGENVRAHRVSYVMAYGSISPDRLACHHCDNPSCVNPLHIYEGTDKDNASDCIERGRRGSGGGKPRKLSNFEVESARIRYVDRSTSQVELAHEFGVGRSTMQRLLQGYTYENAPGPISAVNPQPGRPRKRG